MCLTFYDPISQYQPEDLYFDALLDVFHFGCGLTITVTESRSSKNRMEQEYIETHQGEFMIVKRLHSKSLSVLLEAEIEQANHSLAQLINALNAQMSFWQLNELVSHAWISDGQGEMIYQSSPQKLPFEYIDIKRQVLLKQVPQIWCEKIALCTLQCLYRE